MSTKVASNKRMQFLLVVWILFFIDSFGAVCAKFDSSLSVWYSHFVPQVAEMFPLNTSWVWIYFLLSGMGLLTVIASMQNRKNNDRGTKL